MKVLTILSILFMVSCGSFQAKRVTLEESDEKALSITDKWMVTDTQMSVTQILEQIKSHKGFQKYLRNLDREPRVFVGEVQNDTSEPYFPIEDLNDELLTEFSSSGEYVLIDAGARESILNEINYQNSGMVNPKQMAQIGKQSGADLIILGAIRMHAKTRDGKTIKEYTVNIRMTDLEKGIEVLRTRVRINKYSTN